MKAITKHIIAAFAMAAVTMAAVAQDSSSSSVLRRSAQGERSRLRNNQEQGAPEVTQRMENFYKTTPVSDADLAWMRVIYRQIDLNNEQNAALYYPEEVVDGQENLFRIIMRLLANNQIAAYEYLDGREIFTDQYKVKVRDLLDRFHILSTEAKGSTEKNPKFVIEESDVPANEVLSYYLLEKWQFDTRTNRMRTTVEAICPVLHRSGDFGGEAVKYPMFWVKMDDIRPYLAQQAIFTSDDNNLASASLDDFFTMNMYKGDIYKTRNLRNKSMMQLYPDPDDLKRAQDSIQNRLSTFEDKLWVPSREELAAAREAKAKQKAQADEVNIASRDNENETTVETAPEAKETPKTSTRSSRNKKKPTVKREPKKAAVKQSSSNNSSVRSVRRRR